MFTDFIGACIYQNAGLDVKITGMTDGDYLLLAGPDSGVTTLADAAREIDRDFGKHADRIRA